MFTLMNNIDNNFTEVFEIFKNCAFMYVRITNIQVESS